MKLIVIILLIKWLSITTEAQKTCTYPIAIFNKTVPQTIDFLKIGFGIGFGRDYEKIIIVGTPTNETDQFAINLAEDGELFKTANVPFHFNPRFDEKVILRNGWHKEYGWETEQSSGGFPFVVGQPFVLELESSAFIFGLINIYINNKYFATNIRASNGLRSISQLEITGSVQLTSITFCGIPQPSPSICEEPKIFSDKNIPLNYDFVKIKFGIGFLPKKKITIIGTPISYENGTKDFLINMGESGVMGNNASILFSFNSRFDELSRIILNTWSIEGGWGKEESSGGFPFAALQPFVLEFFTQLKDLIAVNVNYKPFITFSRFDLSNVTQIEISRAIKVSSVIFCKKYV